MRKYFPVIIFVFVALFFLCLSQPVQAAENDLKIYSDNYKLEAELTLFPIDFNGVTELILADVDGDKAEEIVISAGEDGDSLIKVYRASGEKIIGWRPFAAGFHGVVALAAADLNGDGQDEIMAAAGAGGGPQVRIFNGDGTAWTNGTFFVGDKSYRSGLFVAAGDIDGDGKKEIITSSIEQNHALIKFFDQTGKPDGQGFSARLDENSLEPARVRTLDLGQDGIEEILIGLGPGNEPKIKIYRRNGSLINEFAAYSAAFRGGVSFTAEKQSGKNVIITGAGFSGGPHIRFFDGFGQPFGPNKFFGYDENMRGGINVAYGDVDADGNGELLVLPRQTGNGGGYLKYIDIDISEQKLRYYSAGMLAGAFAVSSGLPAMPTPLGEFTVWQKNPRAYSNKYNLFMPWWMSFKPGYGIHELPEWAGGYKEGANHLGKRASHGCVRLGIGPAKTLYDWAGIGTKVIIHE